MKPHPDDMPSKRASRAKTPERASSERPTGKLVSARLHPKPMEPATREEQIRLEAYLHAERRGFAPGRELDDWLAAEAEVDQSMAVKIPPAGSLA